MQTTSVRHSTALGACAALLSLALAAPVSASPGPLSTPEALSVVEEWAPTLFGEGIGWSGLNVADLDGSGTLKIVVGAAQESFIPTRYWYILSHSSEGYRQEWVSPLYTADITALRTADLDGLPGAEIVVAAGEEILIYDGATRELVRTIQTRTPWISGLAIGDADGDGELELAFCGSEDFGRPGLHVYDAVTGEEEYHARDYSCSEVAIGNVDHDPAPEIVLGAAPGYVIDGASRILEWTYEPGFGRMVQLADVDDDGLEEIVVGGTWGTGHITIWDADVRSLAWEIPVSSFGAMLVADLEGDGRPEIVFGDEQWGSVHVWSTWTRNHKWSIKNPANGVAELAVGDTDGDGANELLWGAGHHDTGTDLLCVASTVTLQMEWQSPGVSGPFGALDAGDVDFDGEPELLYGSDDLFVHDARTKDLESELGPPAPADAWSLFRVRHANVDEDPQSEIFTAGYTNYQGVIVCRDGITHEEQWRWTGHIPYSLEVADVDGDGHLEVVTGLGNHVYVLDAATGVEEWQSDPLQGSWGQLSLLRVANVDDDPHLEILVVMYGALYIYDGVTHVQELRTPNFKLGISALDVVDRDGDGTAEILIGTLSGRVAVVDPATGAIEETLGRYRRRINALAAVDLTNDSVPDLVLALDKEVVIYDGRIPTERLWRSGLIGGGVGQEDALLVADIDQDGRTEIVVSLGLIGIRVYEVGAPETGPPPGPYLESSELPGFRFKVRITAGDQEFAGAQEGDCLAETLCVSGALAGRSELFLRVIGPRPNGFLWVNLVRFTPSRVEVWVEQIASGQVNYYELPALPSQDTQLSGLVDKSAFVPGAAAAARGWVRPRPLGAPGVSTLQPASGLAPRLGSRPGAATFTSEAFPGYRFSVRILSNGVEQSAQLESDCLAETVCVSGALPGRSELFLRIIGPRPNGFLWANLVRFTTSRVEVEIEQLSTGKSQTYVLDQVPAQSDQLPGRLDRAAFSP